MADVNAKLQERLSRRPEGWEDMVLAALAGDPVFYGVMASITICMLAFVGLLAAKVLLDQLEEDEATERQRTAPSSASSARKGGGDRSDESDDNSEGDGDEVESKKQQ